MKDKQKELNKMVKVDLLRKGIGYCYYGKETYEPITKFEEELNIYIEELLKQLKQRIKDEVLYHPINGNEKQDTQYKALEKVFGEI